MLTEYHCHILPGIDDGAESEEISLGMIEMMKQQGVGRLIATPHFYAHREKSLEHYIQKRQEAYEKIKDAASSGGILLGAEVSIERGICEIEGIEKLAVSGTDLILLELPYKPYEKWMSEEIYNMSAEFGLTVILAHVHRYLEYYTKEQLQNIIDTKAILQINNEAFTSWSEKRLVKKILGSGKRVVFGSDAHDTSERKPNWNVLKKKCDPEIIAASDSILDEHMK